MIDLQKSVIEAEALAKLRKEQFYRETLAQELAVMIDEHFKSKEPLREVIPQFVVALKDLVNTSCEIFYYLEGVENDRMKLMKELEARPITAAEEAPSTAAEPEEPEQAAEEPELLTALKEAAYRDVNKMMGITAAEPEEPKAAEPEAPKAAEPKKRIPSKDIISDEELERHYFKEGLSIPVIASMFKVGASGLYKRIEQMKADRKKIEKECAR